MTTARTARATALIAVPCAALLAAAAGVDQASTHQLIDHASAIYAPNGKTAAPAIVYGILYAVAAVSLTVWTTAALAARRRGLGIVALTTATVVTIASALGLFTVAEYGSVLYPPVWGLLALIPLIPGAAATVQLARRGSAL
ncbi:hypothetical protein [Gordonia sp. (in: high G+C Gram-positive bacteria)]|uniref:hypothetical protein n=1 Tax=Gordonia sp. (in: high G+C Gram-positive bacteria) TaxID=84139 RepID=UPI0039E58FF9